MISRLIGSGKHLSFNGIIYDLKKENKTNFHEKTDIINSVQSFLKSHSLWVTLYMSSLNSFKSYKTYQKHIEWEHEK